jgi:L-lactate dehydrogenase
MLNIKKVAIIGCGHVGSTVTFNLIQKELFSEIVLIDVNKDKAEGEVMDLSHSSSFLNPINIYAGNYDDIVDAGLIIITAGVSRKSNESRLDLTQRNVEIFKNIIPEIKKRDCKGILLVISNPVDILTQLTIELSGFPSHRVIGSGTILDTARLKRVLANYLHIDTRDINAYILGEHGNSELTIWSNAQIFGVSIHDFLEQEGIHNYEEIKEKVSKEVIDSGKEIITRKNATFYGIAACVNKIANAIVNDENTVLPVSSLVKDKYGINDVCLSLPCIINSKGVQRIVEVELSESEKSKLIQSSETLKNIYNQLNI